MNISNAKEVFENSKELKFFILNTGEHGECLGAEWWVFFYI